MVIRVASRTHTWLLDLQTFHQTTTAFGVILLTAQTDNGTT